MKYWDTGLKEYYRSFFKRGFLKALQKLVPKVKISDIKKSNSGVRAQALSINGNLIDDFIIQKNASMIHIINAPSPAATSSLAIGKRVAELYIQIKN